MGRNPVNLPSDEFRCTGIDDKHGGRCSRPRLPAITLCRIHHLLQLQPIPPSTTTIVSTNLTAVAQPNKRGRPQKNTPLTLPSPAVADAQALPSKKRGRPPTKNPTTTTPSPTVASDTPPEQQKTPNNRCTRNDGRGWRCSRPSIPGRRYCDKHDQYSRRGSATKQKHPSLTSSAQATTMLPQLTVKNEVDNAPKPAPCSPKEKPPAVKMEAEGEVLELSNTAMPAEKPPVGCVWALPATPGGPPRSYARIHRIIHGSGQAEVTPLVFHPVSIEEIGWDEEGRTLACGTFRATSHPTVVNIYSLSHQVASSEMGRSFFKVFPMSGEVWAVYDGLEAGATYHLAEIVSGFTEDGEVTAARLVPMEGGGFRRELDRRYELRRTFTRRDLLWFSHQVLAIRMSVDGEDAAARGGGLWKVFS